MYQEEYRAKLVKAADAVKIVENGNWIEYGTALNVPLELDKALADRAEELEDINIRLLLATHNLKIFEANDRLGKRVFTVNSYHFGGVERKRIIEGKKDCFFAPMRYQNLPGFYRKSGQIEKPDVVMIQVAPMDDFGYFSFGPSNSHSFELIKRADKVILEVNKQMPRVFGLADDCIHVSDVDFLIETDNPLDIISSSDISDIDMQIGANVAGLIKNGDTLQLGIGGIPNAIGTIIAKSGLRDLGVHTEMYVDAFMEMTKAGVISGKFKERDRIKQVYAFCAGSKELYEFIKENPVVVSAPVDYVNDPSIIGSFENFVSINSAMQVDISGQVNAESIGLNHFTGTGGQLDFVLGAGISKNGRSIIAIPSSYIDKNGKRRSKIVADFCDGGTVTDPKTIVDYIVTEYGVANLRGKSSWQRAEALIDIAHPDFKTELIEAAKKRNFWRRFDY